MRWVRYLPLLLVLGGCWEQLSPPPPGSLPLNPEPSADPEPISRGGTEVGSPLKLYTFDFDGSTLRPGSQLDLCLVGYEINQNQEFDIEPLRLVVRAGSNAVATNLPGLPKSYLDPIQSLSLKLEPECGESQYFAFRLLRGLTTQIHEWNTRLEFLHPVQTSSSAGTDEALSVGSESGSDQRRPERQTLYLRHEPFVSCVNEWRAAGRIDDGRCFNRGELSDIQHGGSRFPGGGRTVDQLVRDRAAASSASAF
jgi:hypothetical protein